MSHPWLPALCTWRLVHRTRLQAPPTERVPRFTELLVGPPQLQMPRPRLQVPRPRLQVPRPRLQVPRPRLPTPPTPSESCFFSPKIRSADLYIVRASRAALTGPRHAGPEPVFVVHCPRWEQ